MIRYTKTNSSDAPDQTRILASTVTSVSVSVNGPETRDVALYATLNDNESLCITFTPEAAVRLYRGLGEALGKVGER